MKWTIQQLNVFKNKGLQIDDTVDVSDIKQLNREIREIKPIKVKGKADFSTQSVTFFLDIEGEMTLPCSRTLADVNFPFHINTTEVFKLDQRASAEEDLDFHQPDGDIIDLVPYINEAILLEIPIQVFSEGLKGEAPESGEDWELLTEENKKQRIDPRLADLAKFFDDK